MREPFVLNEEIAEFFKMIMLLPQHQEGPLGCQDPQVDLSGYSSLDHLPCTELGENWPTENDKYFQDKA